jgi:hypothetical protein
VYSQNGEDGILLWLFSVIGTTNRKFVEFGVGDGRECNTRLLSSEWGWSGLQIEGEERFAAEANEIAPPGVKVICSYVSPENINALIENAGLEGDIDLLSIDIDGNDYWLWKAVNSVSPRAVVVEYNASYGPNAVIVPTYSSGPIPTFGDTIESKLKWGSSLAALSKLASDLGYKLIGCESSGVNAFFVRNDCVNTLPEFEPGDAWKPNQRVSLMLSQEQQEK